ncbi:glutathione S-transferase N-terminal domain-containing protein [Paracoccus aerius]|uniref:Glutathione S-transferase n=1 Tax=Paracoccus aerius TaxID=1915382 RepID=A0ABS1SDS6_9RHOB|nr:glutathione S-transferase N-terminal domain-containing protein [Paracoccus aerius]MBL3675656.1 glutathione S-transferase [Paracoccus aerius]GHG36176.1 glutathione S-transferase [Paracoccus aerius]
MSDFTLYYWPVPFRGEFVRAILAHVGASVDEPGSDAISDMMSMDPRNQPVPHMASPMLVDNGSGKAMAEMPAICFWLSERFDLLPPDPHLRAITLKIVSDANDVLDEMTLSGGKAMWTEASWADYLVRLRRWMAIWEAMAEQDLLPEQPIGLAQIVTATLWGTMTKQLPELRAFLAAEAPQVAGLTSRIRSHGALAGQAEESRRRFGQAWCGGEIEKSLRRVLRG